MTREELENKFEQCFNDNTSRGNYDSDYTDKWGFWRSFKEVVFEYSESENAALRQQVKDMGEVIKELNGRIINLQSADMTHEYNQAEAQRVWPQIEQQIRDDEREKTLAQFGITTGPENS